MSHFLSGNFVHRRFSFHAGSVRASRTLLIGAISFATLLFLGQASALAFLDTPMDARAMAMGNAVLADPVSPSGGVRFNPAHLGYLEAHRELLASRRFMTETRNLDHVAYAQPLRPGGALAVWMTSSTEAGIEERDSTGTLISLFGHRQSELALAYGLKLSSRVACGASYRLMQEEFPGVAGEGRGLTLGLAADVFKGLRAGVVARDLESRIDWRSGLAIDVREINPSVAAGLTYSGRDFTISAETDKAQSSHSRFRGGMEWSVGEKVFLRAGWDDDHATFGTGFRIKNLFVDYAYSLDEDDPQAHLSIVFKFYRLDLFRELERFRPRPAPRAEEAIIPDSVKDAVKALGLAREKGDMQIARAHAVRLMALEPANLRWVGEMGNLAMAGKDFESARVYYEELRRRSGDPEVTATAEKIIREIDARAFLTATAGAAVAGRGELPGARFMALGDLSLSEGRFASALGYYDQAVEAGATGDKLAFGRARSLLGAGERTRAILALEDLRRATADPALSKLVGGLLDKLSEEVGKVSADPLKVSLQVSDTNR